MGKQVLRRGWGQAVSRSGCLKKRRAGNRLQTMNLFAQSHQWKHQWWNMWNLPKVSNKDTRQMSLTLFWGSSVFSFSIFDFEQVKSQLGKTINDVDKWWRCHWRCSGILTVNFKHISFLTLVFWVFPLLPLNR